MRSFSFSFICKALISLSVKQRVIMYAYLRYASRTGGMYAWFYPVAVYSLLLLFLFISHSLVLSFSVSVVILGFVRCHTIAVQERIVRTFRYQIVGQ